LPYETLDLGAEWVQWSGLPMVFATWAGQPKSLTSEAAEAFRASYHWGRDHLDEMVEHASAERGFSKQLARDYFTSFIKYPLGRKHLEGLTLFRKLVAELDRTSVAV
jgi:predicted solute-binding protein